MSLVKAYTRINEAMEDVRAILTNEDLPPEARVKWGQSVIRRFDLERETMIREHEDYRKEVINGPR